MSPLLLAELAVFVLLEIVPCAVLTAAPFRERLGARRVLALFTALLYFLGIVRRVLALAVPSAAGVLYLAWIILYACAGFFTLRAPISQILFTLFAMLNYAGVVSILLGYIASLLFPAAFTASPYCFQVSLTAFVVYVPSFPLLYRFFTRRVGPLMAAEGQEKIWNLLWLVPATFSAIYSYSVYAGSGALGFSSRGGNVLFTLLVSAGSFFVLYLVLRLVEEHGRALRLEAENHQLGLQTLQYGSLMARMEETRRAQHDLRQYTTVLQSYLRSADRETLDTFVSAVCAALPPDTPFLYCTNPTLNAVISYYAGLADRAGASFTVQANCLETPGVRDADLAVLLGNLLENAVESCARQREGARFLRLSLRRDGDNLVLVLDNSCGDRANCRDGRFHSSKHEGDGIGTASVRRIAARYGGVAKLEQDGGVFRASVLLPMPQTE